MSAGADWSSNRTQLLADLRTALTSLGDAEAQAVFDHDTACADIAGEAQSAVEEAIDALEDLPAPQTVPVTGRA